jgi:tetratricopeptide (TPR) repeat protein
MRLAGRLRHAILLILLFSAVALVLASAAVGQAGPAQGSPIPPWKRQLAGEDATRVETLEKQIAQLKRDGRFSEATAPAREVAEVRARRQGSDHWEAADARRVVDDLRTIAALPEEGRTAMATMGDLLSRAIAAKDRGQYAESGRLCRTMLDIRRRWLGEDHPDTGESYNNVAFNLDEEGKYAAAQPLYEKALEINRRFLGEDHPLTAASYNNVASNLDAQGKYARAQPLRERALAIRRRLFSDDHPDTGESYNNVAFNLHSQGKYARAQPLYEKALQIRRRLLDDDHPDTAAIFNNVAANLYSQGKYAEARLLNEKVLEIRRRLLGEDHAETAQSYHNLAASLSAQGKYAEAEAMNRRAVEIRLKALGEDHPDTARNYNNLATTLSAQGKYAEAQPLCDKALAISRRLLGEDHPDTARSYDNVAFNLHHQGKYAEARLHHEKALEIRRRLLGEDHAETAISYASVAWTLSAQGKYIEARDQLQRAVKCQDKASLQIAFTGLERVGAVLSMRSPLAAVQAQLGEPAEAWQSLEAELGRGLIDEVAAREDRRLSPDERARLRDLIAALERLDRLVESTPKDLDGAERSKRFESLRRDRELASIALGEFQTGLVRDHPALAGPVATLGEIQAVLPADAALLAWVDLPPVGPKAADPDGEHWGVVVRARGVPSWVAPLGAARMGCGPTTTPGSRTASGQGCGAGPASARPTCGPWSRSYTASASSRWRRPSPPRPTASRRPPGSSSSPPGP